ncbi:hypothetical protein D3C78_1786490 [compost metagenome]
MVVDVLGVGGLVVRRPHERSSVRLAEQGRTEGVGDAHHRPDRPQDVHRPLDIGTAQQVEAGTPEPVQQLRIAHHQGHQRLGTEVQLMAVP